MTLLPHRIPPHPSGRRQKRRDICQFRKPGSRFRKPGMRDSEPVKPERVAFRNSHVRKLDNGLRMPAGWGGGCGCACRMIITDPSAPSDPFARLGDADPGLQDVTAPPWRIRRFTSAIAPRTPLEPHSARFTGACPTPTSPPGFTGLTRHSLSAWSSCGTSGTHFQTGHHAAPSRLILYIGFTGSWRPFLTGWPSCGISGAHCLHELTVTRRTSFGLAIMRYL
jgi:hypothetical protein